MESFCASYNIVIYVVVVVKVENLWILHDMEQGHKTFPQSYNRQNILHQATVHERKPSEKDYEHHAIIIVWCGAVKAFYFNLCPIPCSLAYVAPPLSEEKITSVSLSIPSDFSFCRILPTPESNSITASPYLWKYTRKTFHVRIWSGQLARSVFTLSSRTSHPDSLCCAGYGEPGYKDCHMSLPQTSSCKKMTNTELIQP